VVDLGLPDGSGIDVIRAAQIHWPDCGIMVSTAFGDEAHVMRSIEAGATGYLLKDSHPGNMMEEIRSLYRGGSPISPLIGRQVLMRFRNASSPGSVTRSQTQQPSREPSQGPAAGNEGAALSPREKEVLDFITKGFTAEEIAGLMHISRHTVLTFVRRIYEKLKVTSRVEAILEARSRGILAD
jgi:DNA-binding NarL/FixJ family response regulator